MKVTDEMVERAYDAYAALEADGAGARRRVRAVLEITLQGIVPLAFEHSRWEAFSDEDLAEINAGASERAEKLSLPEDVRRRAEGIYNETSLENQRRKGGYQGPGVYELSTGREMEVLGRHGEDGGIVLRDVGDTSGHLYFETWNKFNYLGLGNTPTYRYLRPLDSEKSAP